MNFSPAPGSPKAVALRQGGERPAKSVTPLQQPRVAPNHQCPKAKKSLGKEWLPA
jgi:hypothetical protein